MMSRFTAAFTLSFVLVTPGFAADIEGAKDHALVGRYAGSSIVFQKFSEFDELALLKSQHDYAALLERDAVSDRTGSEWLKLESRVTKIRYEIPADRSSLEVLRNYESALKGKGFQSVFSCADQSCFTGNLRDPYLLGQQIDTDNGDTSLYLDHARYSLMKLERQSGAVFAAILTGEDNERKSAFVIVLETKAMEGDKIAFLDASDIDSAIGTEGKVSLYGILFDTGKDDLKPESRPTLDEIAKLLSSKPQLRLQIVGHTDDRGTPDYNLELSSRRAGRVVFALINDYAISSDRLTSSGAGLCAPRLRLTIQTRAEPRTDVSSSLPSSSSARNRQPSYDERIDTFLPV